MIVPRMHLHTRAPRHWRTCPCFGPVTGSPPAGTEAPWRWSNPPKSPAGTQKWASPRALSSSRSALDHAVIQGTPLGMAFGSHAPPGPTPLCLPYLESRDGSFSHHTVNHVWPKYCLSDRHDYVLILVQCKYRCLSFRQNKKKGPYLDRELCLL